MPLLRDLRLAMRLLAGVPGLWIAVAACSICALSGFEPAWTADLVLVHARVYASPGDSPLDDATIVLRGGQIASAMGR